MSSSAPCYGIIPARYDSSRFPGKPLVDIAGKPMFWHVWNQARKCAALHSVTLATDDTRIMQAATELAVPCVMTAHTHASGTDRVYEAACTLAIPSDAVVINIQGDEPLLDPLLLDELLTPFTDVTVRVVTAASRITPERAASTNQVKIALAANGDALYFSRAVIPCGRDAMPASFIGHIGLYAFRMETLARFVSLPPSTLEETEKLEQLRLLENAIPIRVVLTDRHAPGVDSPEDLVRVQALMAAYTS